MKTCSKCNVTRPLDNFGRRKAGNDGLNSVCKLCMNRLQKLYKYRIDEEEYYKLIENHTIEGEDFTRCAICLNEGHFIDHDRETGAVRGILCRNCNSALGAFNEDFSLFYRAFTYLQKFEIQAVMSLE